jgi:hypothetical protein
VGRRLGDGGRPFIMSEPHLVVAIRGCTRAADDAYDPAGLRALRHLPGR